MERRQNLENSTAALAAKLTPRERVDRALRGDPLDRPPFTLWHHFRLPTPEAHSQATLEFHRDYRTDLVKVMSDFPYPRPAGKWYELKVESNPFPPQIRALELIRDGLGGRKYFVETLFNPWKVAEKLSSEEEVLRLKAENPQALLDALEAIAASEINHVKRALATGAAGIFLSVANAESQSLSPQDYLKFSAPFDRRILEAASGARFNILHLHVESGYLDFFRDFPAAAINYSTHVSGIPFAEVRRQFPAAPLMGGIDEVNYGKLTPQEMAAQWHAAQAASGAKYVLAPGCSVPDNSTAAELARLPDLVGA
ncbi:MAG: uroporphyrinogen decarboxylase family protein [Bryobacteraceae bacterium]